MLLGLLFDHGIPSDRAWRAPLLLRQRLGHLDPRRIILDPEAVASAIGQPPALHRYRATLARWVVEAARQVVSDYGSDTSAIWSDSPSAAELSRRLQRFTGIGAVKAQRARALLDEVGGG